MKTTKIWANLGVENLDRTTEFYTTIGFIPNGRSEELTSFRVGEDEFVIHFFLKNILKHGIGGEIADLKNGNEVIFSLSADSKEEVNNWESEVRKAGGNLISTAAEFGEGYYGFV